MKHARFLIVIAVLLLPAPGLAGEEAVPDPELVEFLGNFETARGKPIDPLVFHEQYGADQKKEKPAEVKTDRKRRKVKNKNEQKDPDNEN